jgi:hypothetical protein
MTTLFQAMLGLANRGPRHWTGSATGGTTTTLIDTVQRKEADDNFNGMTLFVLDGDNADLTRRITDFVQSTATLTVGAFSNAMAAGDRYLISQAVREDLVQAINAALTDIGDVTQVDTSLTVVADQTEYSLPSGVSNVVRVEVAESASADYDYQRAHNWREISGSLYFTDELGFTAGRTIRLYYNAQHAAVDADADTISDGIPLALLVDVAVYYYWLQQYSLQGNLNMKEDSLLAMYAQNKERAMQRYSVNKLQRDPTYLKV